MILKIISRHTVISELNVIALLDKTTLKVLWFIPIRGSSRFGSKKPGKLVSWVESGQDFWWSGRVGSQNLDTRKTPGWQTSKLCYQGIPTDALRLFIFFLRFFVRRWCGYDCLKTLVSGRCCLPRTAGWDRMKTQATRHLAITGRTAPPSNVDVDVGVPGNQHTGSSSSSSIREQNACRRRCITLSRSAHYWCVRLY